MGFAYLLSLMPYSRACTRSSILAIGRVKHNELARDANLDEKICVMLIYQDAQMFISDGFIFKYFNLTM